MVQSINSRNFDAWIFDLDNTLYPYKNNLFDQIDLRIQQYVSNSLNISLTQAHTIQKQYFNSYGTTLLGLMENYDINPYDFLNYVHNVDLNLIKPDLKLTDAVSKLPGQKIIFTNADLSYAERVINQIGFERNTFDFIFDIEAANWLPKPNYQTYLKLINKTGINPNKSIFFEDIPTNLIPASKIGMTTVWLENNAEWATLDSDYLQADYKTNSLSDWLIDFVDQVS